MPAPCPQNSRDDIVLAAPGQDSVTPARLVRHINMHELTLSQQRCQNDLGDSKKPGTLRAESAQIRGLKKRIRLFEQAISDSTAACLWISHPNRHRRGSAPPATSPPPHARVERS